MSGKSFGATYIENEYKFFPTWKPDEWNIFCVTHSSSSGEFKMFINNDLVFQYDNILFRKKEKEENVFLLNAFSYQKNDYIFPFDGSITDLNIWSSIFSSEEVREWSDCKSENPADILSWENAEFKLYGDIQTIEVEKKEICLNKNSKRFMAFNEKMNFIDSVKFCEKLGGEIAVAEDFETLKNIQNTLLDFRNLGICPTLLYTGVNIIHYFLMTLQF